MSNGGQFNPLGEPGVMPQPQQTLSAEVTVSPQSTPLQQHTPGDKGDVTVGQVYPNNLPMPPHPNTPGLSQTHSNTPTIPQYNNKPQNNGLGMIPGAQSNAANSHMFYRTPNKVSECFEIHRFNSLVEIHRFN